jgi:hypothetical protein
MPISECIHSVHEHTSGRQSPHVAMYTTVADRSCLVPLPALTHITPLPMPIVKTGDFFSCCSCINVQH